MFSRRKPDPPKKRSHDLSQYGLMDIPDDFDPTSGFGDDDDDAADSDLEAELAAIAGGGGKPKPKQKAKPQLVDSSELDKMIADSLRDVGTDDEGDDDDDDPDLLGELQDIAGDDLAELKADDEDAAAPSIEPPIANEEPPQTFLPTTTMDVAAIIRQRIELYKLAESNAKAANETSKVRRFGRGLKTLNDLLKQVNAGKTINVDDIPVEIAVKNAPEKPTPEDANAAADEAPPVPIRSAPAPPPADPIPDVPAENIPSESTTTPAVSPQNPIIEQMRTRQAEYKAAALQSKRSGDIETAMEFLKVFKQFDAVIKMCAEGQEVDLSDMPPPPDQFKEFMAKMKAAAGAPVAENPTPAAVPERAPPVVPDQKPAAPTSMLEALQQRLDVYKSIEEKAKGEGNARKARTFGRIVKQYEEAIKLHKAGRPVQYDELPVPLGFGPLQTEDVKSTPASKPSPPPIATGESSSSDSATATPTPGPKRSIPEPQEMTTRTSGNHKKNNLAEEQMKTLLARQKEFKKAAIEAKKAGEIEQAKEYLKMYKGFEALLNAACNGLRVDMNSLPLPPSQREGLEESFEIVATEVVDVDDDISDIGVRVEEQLAMQLMMCKNTRDHHKAMGDVAGMNRFENLAVTVQKDLDLVRYSKRKKFPLPKFHYEKRSFNIVHCNTDLTDNELEIVVVRGITYNVANPKDVDTYVKIEFPLLNDEAFRTKTTVIKDTDSPEYDQRFKVDIQRTRQFQRIFKRHGVKFEVYSRGCSLDCCGLSRILPICCFSGFLRSDTLIGTVVVKLQPLETKTDIHDTFNLMDGRKAVGGKLEIKLRVRNPMLTKQVQHLNEKWLVLDAVES